MQTGKQVSHVRGLGLEGLLASLGEHFVGLWIYKPFSGDGKKYWFVTFRDDDNQLWETDRQESPASAIAQAIDCLLRKRAGTAVNPENIGANGHHG